jgi:hypothetical protein
MSTIHVQTFDRSVSHPAADREKKGAAVLPSIYVGYDSQPVFPITIIMTIESRTIRWEDHVTQGETRNAEIILSEDLILR